MELREISSLNEIQRMISYEMRSTDLNCLASWTFNRQWFYFFLQNPIISKVYISYKLLIRPTHSIIFPSAFFYHFDLKTSSNQIRRCSMDHLWKSLSTIYLQLCHLIRWIPADANKCWRTFVFFLLYYWYLLDKRWSAQFEAKDNALCEYRFV